MCTGYSQNDSFCGYTGSSRIWCLFFANFIGKSLRGIIKISGFPLQPSQMRRRTTIRRFHPSTPKRGWLRNLLHLKDVPYGLVIVIGLFGYCVNAFIDDLTKSPILAYKFEQQRSTKIDSGRYSHEFFLRLSNISKNTKFDTVLVLFRYSDTAAYPWIKDVTAQCTTISMVDARRPDYRPSSAFYTMTNIQPGTIYQFNFTVISDSNECRYPKVSTQGRSVVNFREEGLESLLIKHQAGINEFFIGVLFITICFYIVIVGVFNNK